MKECKVGDYFLSKTKQLYRVIDSYDNGKYSVYDIKSLDNSNTYKCLDEEWMDLAGIVIPEENISEMVDLLYGSKKNNSGRLRYFG